MLLAAAMSSADADPAAVRRGAYLAAAAGCDQCHTDSKNGGQPYAGGRIIESEAGDIAAPNITPDKATGIGGWSAADFARAMRWGIAPDGTHYVPAFPFPYFAGLTDGDLADLKAFLDSIAPVSRSVPGASSLGLAGRARAALGVAVAGAAVAPPAPAGDAAATRGAYLVATVGHCGDCHTPLTLLGAPDLDRYLAGSRGGLEGRKAPDITADPDNGIGKWHADDIASLLKDGMTPDNDFVGGAMAEIVRNTARLTDDDRRAIAAYLLSLTPKQLVRNN
ncbi:MAG TPA: cytochrome c [Stellaceae bacterium]|nr:cytochrome c [Stellaceae bacterium]